MKVLYGQVNTGEAWVLSSNKEIGHGTQAAKYNANLDYSMQVCFSIWKRGTDIRFLSVMRQKSKMCVLSNAFTMTFPYPSIDRINFLAWM